MVKTMGPLTVATRRFFLVQPNEPGMPVLARFRMGIGRLWATMPVTSDYRLYFLPFCVFGWDRSAKSSVRE